MNALQINRHRTSDQSSKEALRTHIEQLSLEMQREFIEVALQLIAARPTPCQVEVATSYAPHLPMRQRIITH